MKTLIQKLLGVAVLAFAMATPAHAGIPVIDVTAVLNLVMSYAQQLQQYETLQSQLTTQVQHLETATKQLQSMTGSRGMQALFNNSAVQANMPADWQSVYAAVQSSPTYATERAKFPNSNNSNINAIYNATAASNATMTDFFGKAGARIQQIQNLQTQIDSASDPAAKADLTNRFMTEQNSIAATNQLLNVLKQKQAQDILQAQQTAHGSLVCSEFKNC